MYIVLELLDIEISCKRTSFCHTSTLLHCIVDIFNMGIIFVFLQSSRIHENLAQENMCMFGCVRSMCILVVLQHVSAAVFSSYSMRTAIKPGVSTVFHGPDCCCLCHRVCPNCATCLPWKFYPNFLKYNWLCFRKILPCKKILSPPNSSFPGAVDIVDII